MVTANLFANTISVLLGNGNGTFEPPKITTVGGQPSAVTAVDLTGDGIPDLIVTNEADGTVSVFQGNDDGTFQPPQNYAVGQDPSALALAYIFSYQSYNYIPQLIVLNSGDDTVSVLDGNVDSQGNPDGTFQSLQTIPVGNDPSAVAVTYGFINGSYVPELAVTNAGDNTLSLLAGNPDGTYSLVQTIAVGNDPSGVAATYQFINGNYVPELAVTNAVDGTVSMLVGNVDQYGNPDGTYSTVQTLNVGNSPSAIASTYQYINGNYVPELAVTNSADGTVSVLAATVDQSGNADGTFYTLQTVTVGKGPSSISTADVNGDGNPDLVVTNSLDNTISVLLGNANGTFQYLNNVPKLGTFKVGSQPDSVSVADVNGDGNQDLVVANRGDGTVSVLLGSGGLFKPATPASGAGPQNIPLLASLVPGNSSTDSVILDRDGNILFRTLLPGSNTRFGPPVTLNADQPARAITTLDTGNGPAVAAIDSPNAATFNAAADTFNYTVSLYTLGADGKPLPPTTAFTTTILPTSIAAGNLTDSIGTSGGLDDIVVASALDNSVTIAFQTAPGVFDQKVVTLPVGIAPSDISLVDVNGDGLLDIVVTDESSGDVTVLLNNPEHTFLQTEVFRAGTGLYGLSPAAGTFQVSSPNQSVSLAAGDFTGDGRNDLVVVNRGSHSITVLPNDGHGGFANPTQALTDP